MPEVLEAREAYKQADQDALKMRFRARARLGVVILQHRKKTGDTQKDVAETMNVVPEQVRRYEAAARAWARQYPNEPIED